MVKANCQQHEGFVYSLFFLVDLEDHPRTTAFFVIKSHRKERYITNVMGASLLLLSGFQGLLPFRQATFSPIGGGNTFGEEGSR